MRAGGGSDSGRSLFLCVFHALTYHKKVVIMYRLRVHATLSCEFLDK